MKGLIVGVVLAAIVGVLVWKAPPHFKESSTWIYVGAVVGGIYLLLARPFS